MQQKKITRKLKGINFIYDPETQTLKIQTGQKTEEGFIVKNEIIMDKVYMFSTGIFIDFIKRRQFIRKSDINKLNKLKGGEANG